MSTCQNCGEDEHGTGCNTQGKCANCLEAHPSASRDCYYYKFENEVLSIQAKERVSYPDAKRQVSTRYVTPNKTYTAGQTPVHQREGQLPPWKLTISCTCYYCYCYYDCADGTVCARVLRCPCLGTEVTEALKLIQQQPIERGRPE